MQHAVGPPVLDQLDRCPGQVAALFFELALETLEQGKSISGRTGKPGQHPTVIQAPHLARVAFHDRVAESDLTIAADDHAITAPHGNDGGAVKTVH